ncbi:MAG: alkaline phosphatase [Betaproteobacteria bacterium]|nr:alkaline phosphatase [Betaproteobacteria bacterium]
MFNLNLRAVSAACVLALATGVAAASAASAARAPAADPGRAAMTQAVPTGNVIFFHPDGAGLNHWNAHRMYFHGLDGISNKDRLPHMAVYRSHMHNLTNGTSHGGATVHAFGYKVDAFGSFGMDGDGSANPPTNRAIRSLSGFQGSIVREAANAGIPVGLVNDGHIGEPGTGAFLAEVGNRNEWQEITRQMIVGRPGMNDTAPWVIMGGGEADALPQGASTVHRNVNEERRAPVNSRTSLRTDDLNLIAAWNAMGSGNLSNDPMQRDDFIVLRTRAEFENLRQALRQHSRYAPRVLGLFAFQDTFNDRNEQDLINRGFVRANMQPGSTGPAPNKQSRLVLFGDHSPTEPGYNPPTFAEMTEVAIEILSRAAAQRPQAAQRRFFLVAEQEAIDNFGNNNNAIGMLHGMEDTDRAIGKALDFLRRNERTLIVTAADSDAGNMTVVSSRVSGVTPPSNILPAGRTPDNVAAVATNPSAAIPAGGTGPDSATVNNFLDGVEGRQSPMFVTEPDQFGNRMQFGIAWPGTSDYHGAVLSRAAGLNAGLLSSRFSARFDNVDVYRLKHATLFGRMLNYPTATEAPGR